MAGSRKRFLQVDAAQAARLAVAALVRARAAALQDDVLLNAD